MPYSNEWLQFYSAEDTYFACRYNLMQDKKEMIADLAKALATVEEKETALRLLLETKPEAVVLPSLLPRVIDLAIDSSNMYTIELAREVLRRYKSEPRVRTDLQALAMAYLAENDEWHYRRIAELYQLLDYREELASFMVLRQKNVALEIQEIVEDFIEPGSL